MDTLNKLKSLKNPYKNTDIVVDRELRVGALKQLAKLYGMELLTRKRKDTKVNNIFLDNKKLTELINLDTLTPKESNKIHNLIVKDFNTLQGDLDKTKKTLHMSDKQIEKTKIKSKKITCKLDKMFKPNTGLIVGKKAGDFCLKHKIKLLVGGSVMLLTSMTSLISNPIALNAKSDIKTLQVQGVTIDDKNKKKEDKLSLLASQSKQISNISFVLLDKVNPNSKNFNEKKELYLTYMKELNKIQLTDGELQLSDDELKSLLKMEYMYNVGVKKNISSKSEGKVGDEKIKAFRKISNIDEQINILKNTYDSLDQGESVNVNYKKHGISININTYNGNTVTGLDKFSY